MGCRSNETLQALLERASEHAERGELDDALSGYSQALGLDSSNPDALLGRVTCLRKLRRLDEAGHLLGEALARAPREPRFLREQALLLHAQERYPEALAAFEHLLSRDPDDEKARAGHVAALRALKRFEEAEQELHLALEHHPRFLPLMNERGLLHYDQGQYPEALAAFEHTLSLAPDDEFALAWRVTSLRFLKRFADASKALDEALLRLPRSPLVLNERGLLHYDQGQYPEALTAFEHTLALAPDNEFALAWRITLLHRVGRVEEATKALDEALLRLPRNLSLLNLRGSIHYHQGRYPEALAAFEHVLSLAPSNEFALTWRVISLRFLKRFEEAKKALDEALLRLPRGLLLLNERGLLHHDQGQYPEALAAFEHVLSLAPDNEFALTWYIASLRMLRRFEDARKALDEALQRLPRSTQLLSERGLLAFDQARYPEALAAFEHTLSLAPNDERVLAVSIEALRLLKRFEEAWKVVEAVLQRLPRSPMVLNERGLLHYDQGQYAEALAAFEHTLSLAPNNETALTWRVTLLRTLKRFGDAEAALTTALEHLPLSILLLNERGILLHDQRRYGEALAAFERVLSLAPYNETAHTWRAISLRTLRRFREAEKALQHALELLPQSTMLLVERGYLLYDQRRVEESLATFEHPRALAPYDERALAAHVGLLRVLRRFEDARTSLEEALRRQPRSALLQNERGLIPHDQQRFNEALTAFDEAARADSFNLYARQMKAICLRRLHRYDEARKSLDEVLATTHGPLRAPLLLERGVLADLTFRFAEAEAAFAEAMAVNPTWLEPPFARAEMLKRLGRSSEGLELIQSLERQYPGDPELVNNLGWFHLRRNDALQARAKFERLPEGDLLRELGLGGVYSTLGDHAEAEAHFSLARDLDPWNPLNHTNVARALVRQEKDLLLPRAEEHCRAALALDREFAPALGCLGVIAFRRGHFRESEDWFLASIRASPNRGDYSDLGALYVQTGRHAEARKQLERAVELDPHDVRAWIESGNLHWQLGEKKKALQALRRAMALDENGDEACRALAIVLMQSGELTEAENVLRTVLPRMDPPRRARLQLTLAQVLRTTASRANDRELYEEALQELRTALRFKKDDPENYFELGLILAKLDEYEDALAAFEKCLRLDEHHVEAKRNAARLRKAIQERKVQTRGGTYGGWILGVASFLHLVAVWILFAYKKIDATTLVVLIPLLLGLAVVALLLPWLTRLKLPGVEAELSQPKQSISSGPTGDLTLSSPLPSITRAPRGTRAPGGAGLTA